MRIGLALSLSAILAFGSLAAADLTITFKTSRKGPMGGDGAGSEIHYYSPEFNLVRNAKDQRDALVDFRTGTTYSIDHKKKVVGKLTFDDAFAAMDSLGKAQPAGMGQMMGAMFGDPNDCKVTKGGTETIAGRTCQDWDIKVGNLTMALATDPTLKTPIPEAAYIKMIQSRAAQFAKAGPMGAIYKRLYEEMGKVKGIPLKTHMGGMMGMDITTEATAIDTGAIPAATFALPAGYATEDLGKKLREGVKGK